MSLPFSLIHGGRVTQRNHRVPHVTVCKLYMHAFSLKDQISSPPSDFHAIANWRMK